MKIPAEKIAYMLDSFTEGKVADALDSEDYRTRGLSPMRFRHDCLYRAGLSAWVCNHIYRDGPDGPDTGANDTHLDTALRYIMREIGETWAAQK